MAINIQNQIYIWCGVLTALWIILAFCFIALCVYVKKNFNQRKPEERATVVLKQRQENEFASYFGSAEILPGEELHVRGFSERNPKHQEPSQHLSRSESMVFASDYPPKPAQFPVRQDQGGKPKNTLLNNGHLHDEDRRRGSDNPNFMY